jgi:hypothetical protein
MATNRAVTLLASAARTASTQSSDQDNLRHRGVVVSVKVTASSATPSVVFTVEGKDANGEYYSLLASAAVTGAGTTQLTVYPGATATANVSASAPLPRTWRVKAVAGDADSLTYTVSATLLA